MKYPTSVYLKSPEEMRALFADVPEERFEAFRETGMALQRANQHNRFRSVTLGQTGGVPTAAYAAFRIRLGAFCVAPDAR